MRRSILLIGLAGTLALSVGALGAIGPVRRLAWALLHSADRLPALAADPRVHFEPGAEDLARAIAEILPQAVAAVEAAQGRPFKSLAIYAFATVDAFATYGAGTARPRGTSWGGSVFISPRAQHLPATAARLTAHELSHAHLQQWMPTLSYGATPSWFLEGVATFVSGGGGAEGVSDEEARAAIRRGEHFEPAAENRLLFPATVSIAGLAPERAYPLAYRQASLFIGFLVGDEPARLPRMIADLIAGMPFADAFRRAFGRPVAQAWRDFLAQQP
jgi:hypothetical protein